MKDLCLETDFELSTKAINWVKQSHHIFFETRTCYHDLLNVINTDIFEQSIVGKEVRLFLKKYNLDTKFTGINTFVSNHREYYIGNPHIDFLNVKNEIKQVPYRFNIMVLGNYTDKLFYWNNFDQSKLVDHTFYNLYNKTFLSKAVPGNNPAERWKYLGPPTDIVNNYLIRPSFLRTDLAHTVEVSPGPRLIITVGFQDLTF